MIRIFRRFFDFCGEINKRKFTKSIFLGVLKALFEALKIPAIAVTLHGVLSGNLTVQHILLSFGIMLFSIAGNALANYRSTMLQCEAGYGTCADKRIEIAEHLKYLPMGYFNQNSLGYIASVATRRDVKPLRSIGLKYKFFCVLAKLLPVRTLNWLVGLIYAK